MKLTGEIRYDDCEITTMAFNPIFCTFASGNTSKVIRYWDMEKFNLVSENTIDSSQARKIEFMSNGKYFASVQSDSLKVYITLIFSSGNWIH